MMLRQVSLPSLHTIRTIGVRALADPRTVARAYRDPDRVRPTLYERVAKAALEVGAPLPPPRTVAP